MVCMLQNFEIDKLKGVIKLAEKNISARIVHKHDIEENWLKAVNFIPKQGEIIVYDVDDNYDYERIKIGDGEQNVNDLPFFGGSSDSTLELITIADIDEICGATIHVVDPNVDAF